MVSTSPLTVWLTEWQLAEDGIVVAVDDRVTWKLSDPDRSWMHRLFADRRRADLQLDTYAGGVADANLVDVTGVVMSIEAVTCEQEHTAEGIVPVDGAAETRPLYSTSEATKDGPSKSLYGFLVTLQPRQ